MPHELVRPPKARRGDRVAVLSPSFAAAGAFPAVHEQAMRRLAEVTGLVPVEFPATRKVGATPAGRAADVNAAFADPGIRAILAVVGGDDQITVIPHLEAALARRDPKPFLGYSDNTHLHHWLWVNGIASFYGGSSQVHLGPGPGVDEVHARSLRAALVTGDRIEITELGESEDFGVDWAAAAASGRDRVSRQLRLAPPPKPARPRRIPHSPQRHRSRQNGHQPDRGTARHLRCQPLPDRDPALRATKHAESRRLFMVAWLQAD